MEGRKKKKEGRKDGKGEGGNFLDKARLDEDKEIWEENDSFD